MKILVVEDDADLREIITAFLKKERYVVEEAPDYATARMKTFIYEYDCFLLDIMLPGRNGLSLLREMAKQKIRRNVIILSAKDSIEDKVQGLDLGADDYLPKPFHLSELGARIKSVMRRNGTRSFSTITIGNVTLDPYSYSACIDGTPLELSRKEYDILRYLVDRLNHLIEKQTLAEAVWGDAIDQCDNFDFIYAQMKNLRRKLREKNATIEIKTVYGFGYKLVEL